MLTAAPSSRLTSREIALLAAVSAGLCAALSLVQGARENAAGNMGWMHVREAGQVLAGNGFGHWHYEDFVPDLFTRPVYTLFLCPAVALFGAHWEAMRAVVAAMQGGLNALTAVALAAVLMRAGAPRAARFAAWGVILHPVLVWQGATFVDTTIFAAALVGAYAVLVAVPRDAPWWRWFVAGLVLGVAVLTRFTAVTLAPALVFVIVRRCGFSVRGIAATALVAAGAFVVCVPWLVRNHALTDRWMLSTVDGVNLWMGNSPDTARFLDEDRSLDELPGRRRFDSAMKYTVAEQVESCDAARAAAEEFMRAHPGPTAVLALRKAGDLWSLRPTPHSTASKLHGLKDAVGVLWTAPMYLLALLGAVLAWRGGGELRAFAVAVVLTAACFTAPHAIAWGGTRLRAPLDPFLVGLAAVGAAGVVAKLRRPD